MNMILRTVLIYQFFLKSFTRFTLLIFALEGKKKKKRLGKCYYEYYFARMTPVTKNHSDYMKL